VAVLASGPSRGCVTAEQSRADHAAEIRSKRRGWPATPRNLSGILRRLAPALAESGIVVEFDRAGHERQRIIRVAHETNAAVGPAEVLPFEVRTSVARSGRSDVSESSCKGPRQPAGWDGDSDGSSTNGAGS
jgi:hypothetical protein